MLLAVVFVAGVFLIIYKKYTRVFNTWKERGIAFIPGCFPFGSAKELPLQLKYPGYVIDEMYKKFSDQPYFGFYNARSPTLVIRDPEMVKIVLTKEFSHFRDRLGVELPKEDPLAHHLFNLEGERWRALRVKMSPTFTSGKLKGMYQHFIDGAKVLDKYLMSTSKSVIDAKDITGRFTLDIISSCAFGIEVNSIEDENNVFRMFIKDVIRPTWKARIRSVLTKVFPQLSVFLQLNLSDWKLRDFMVGLIGKTINYRTKNDVKRNDFLDLLIQLKNDKGTVLIDDHSNDLDAKKPEPVEMTLELITAQCFVFVLAGFETSSSVQSYALYELALNPEIQDRTRRNISSKVAAHGGLTYQSIQEMDYLDMVVSETLRKYPTLSQLTRRCTNSYNTPFGHRIEKGDFLVIPVWSLHHDPANYPEPEKFDPERFSSENKNSIKPYTYLPFGEGPRICIGMRFGQLQTKMGLITVLRKFSVEPTDQTPVPMVHGAHPVLTPPFRPILLRFTKIPPAF